MKLLPCPFCGKTETVKLQTSEEFEEENGLEGTGENYYNVVCNAEKPYGPGGCGAGSGFYDSEEKAIESWNTRA